MLFEVGVGRAFVVVLVYLYHHHDAGVVSVKRRRTGYLLAFCYFLVRSRVSLEEVLGSGACCVLG